MEKKLIVDPELLDVIQSSITAGVNEGVKRAIEAIEAEKQLSNKIKYDNRIRNTKLLLKNYRNFKRHINTAIYTEEQLDTEETSEILDKLGIDVYEYDKTIVESILKSKKRTEIIIEHIDTILAAYSLRANSRNDVELKRRSDVIEKLYIKGEKMNQIADEVHASISTIKRDKNRAINEIAILMFRNWWYKIWLNIMS